MMQRNASNPSFHPAHLTSNDSSDEDEESEADYAVSSGGELSDEHEDGAELHESTSLSKAASRDFCALEVFFTVSCRRRLHIIFLSVVF